MRRALAILAIALGFTLALVASAPAYADPGGSGNGQGGPPAHAGSKGNSGGNGGGAGGNVGGNASEQDPPGFNGHIKVHDGDSEAEPIVRNEPHVGCTFHIHGFDFDVDADGTWSIQSWPPTGDRSTVLSGTWTGDDEGNWRTALQALGSGHYRVNADQTDPAAPGAEKHKMFWVECGAVSGATPTPTPSPTPTPTGTPGATPTPTPSPTVAGVQQPPMVGGVTPQVESPAPGAQAGAQQAGRPAQVAGQQAAPASLPSTSTEASSLLAAVLAGAGILLLRRTGR